MMQSIDNCFVDQFSINKWRSETLSALVAHQSFEHNQEKALSDIFADAADAISQWLPVRSTFAKHEARFRQEILDPAVRLHQAMRTSVDRYDIYKPKIRPGAIPERPVGSFTFRDIE